MINQSENEEEEEKKGKVKLIVSWQCLNPECTLAKKERLMTAVSYTLAFYGLEQDTKGKRKVCLDWTVWREGSGSWWAN